MKPKTKVRTTEQVLREQEARAKAERENALTATEGNALIADNDNPWLEMSTALDKILGLPRLKFSKEAEYVVGESESLAIGTRVIAHADEIELGWKRWENNQLIDQRWGRIADNFVPPQEKELPNNEPVVQPDGTSRKPWQFSMELPVTVMDAGEQVLSFTVTSRGGLGAVSAVSRAYGKRLKEGQPGRPILELKGDKYWSNRFHTWVNYPVLTIVGWTDAGGKPLSLRDDLNDDLPPNLAA